jgi:hypothetical protein
VNVIKPENLAIPEHILKLIPPRTPGFGRSRETFNVRTGVLFDAVAPGESIAGATMSFVFNPQRATRLVQQKAMDDSQIGLTDVINEFTTVAFKTKYDGYNRELQKVVADRLVNQLMELSMSRQASASTQMEAMDNLRAIKDQYMGATGFNKELAAKIQLFLLNPKEVEPMDALTPPDGSPIGTDMQDWCSFSNN